MPVGMFLAVWAWEAEASSKKQRRTKYVQRGADAREVEKDRSLRPLLVLTFCQVDFVK